MDGSSRLYTAAGSLVNKKTLIVFSLMIILLLPLSAYAEPFGVTTNKDIYALDEKAIIVGTIADDAPPGYAVLIKVTGPRGDCSVQNVLPAEDNSFASRPVRLNDCGFGEFTVTAFYADQKTTSTFTISDSSQKDAASKLELRILKNVLLQARDALNARVKGLIEAGYVLPEDIAETYTVGVSEASLALQAIEFGDATEAKRHMILAIRDFRQVFGALSDENVTRLEQTSVAAVSDGDSGLVGKYRMLREYYYRLGILAEKNHVEKEGQFKAAALLLTNAKEMIDNGNLDGAERNLERVSALLEEIRISLLDDKENATSDTNRTSSYDEGLARKLMSAADRFERTALGLLNETGSNAEAHAKVQLALSLITNARGSIESQNLELARDSLYSAYKAITEAQGLIESEDRDSGADNSGENSQKSGESDNGEDSDNDDNDKDDDNNKGTKGNDNSEEDQ